MSIPINNEIEKYQRRFINILSKSDPDYKDKGDILELFIALRDFSRNNNFKKIIVPIDSTDLKLSSGNIKTLLYEDVPEEIKNKYSLTYKDTGIDLIKFDVENNNILEIIQCKNYSRRLSHHKLGTFYYWILKLQEQDKNIKPRLIINDKTRYNGELNKLDVEIITNSDIYDYIESNFEFICKSKFNDLFNSFNLNVEFLNQIKDCLNKFNLIYSNSDSIKLVIDPETLNDIDEVCYFNLELEEKQNKLKNNSCLMKFMLLILIVIFMCLLLMYLIK
jgi:hypothetical protein